MSSGNQLAVFGLGIAGAIIGAPFGLSSVGFAVGSVVGSALFPPSVPDQVSVGPQLEDRSITSSTYGTAIPFGFGIMRQAGNILWATDKEERENVESSEAGGKGGPTQQQTNTYYTYHASFAVSFGKPASAVLRLWFNNELVYDAISVDASKLEGLVFRFYPGDETQLPDALHESYTGVGRTPAYRGQCYIIFDDFGITPYNNNIPNITAEIAYDAETTHIVLASTEFDSETTIFNTADNDTLMVDPRRGRIYSADPSSDIGFQTGIRVYNDDGLAETRQRAFSDITAGSLGDVVASGNGICVGDSGYIYAVTNSLPEKPLIVIDPSSLLEIARVGSIMDSHPDVVTSPYNMCEISAINPLGGGNIRFLVIAETTGVFPNTLRDIALYDMTNYERVNTFGITGAGTSEKLFTPIAPLPAKRGYASCWISRHEGGDEPINIWRLSIEVSISVGLFGATLEYDSSLVLVDQILDEIWNEDGNSSFQAVGPIVDKDDDGLIFIQHRGSSTGCFVIKWKENEGIVWVIEIDDLPAPSGSLGGFNSISKYGSVGSGVFAFAGSNGHTVLIDTVEGTIIAGPLDVRTDIDSAWPSFVTEQYFDPVKFSLTVSVQSEPGIVRVYLDRRVGYDANLGDIVTAISAEVGRTPAQLDVSELTNSVRGYLIGRQMSARDAIAQLATAYFFDGVESDGKIVFKKRGRSPVKTLYEQDLIKISADSGDVITEREQQEIELPRRLTVAFIDSTIDYQQNAVSAKRTAAPAPTMRAEDEPTIPLAIALSPTEAQQIAETVLYTGWNERTSDQWRASWSELALDPADVVVLQRLNGSSSELRLTKVTLNGDYTLSMEGVAEDGATIVSDSVGQGSLGTPVKVLPAPSFTELFILDIPLLRDVDSTGNFASRFYVGMAGLKGDWQGGALWESNNAASFSPTDTRCTRSVVHGTVQEALPPTDIPFQIDETTTLTVYLEFGELDSVTELEFLSQENVAAIGNPDTQNWEVILFQNAIANDDGTYTVSRLLRGRRGTDARINDHGVGETFILLQRSSIQSHIIDTGYVGIPRYYKGVGNRQSPAQADTESFAASGADLKPYAPCHLSAEEDSGDIDLAWIRRTRIGGSWKNLTGAVPLSEELEQYQVDIKDGPAGAVLRTLTVSTTAAQYESADITTDFGSTPAALTFEVFQISAVVGRGFGKEETITL